MEGDVFGVRIIPPVVQFFNTAPKSVFEVPITVKNVGKGSKSIRYYGPKSENFSLKVKNPEEPVAPGLAVSAVVVYNPMQEKQEKDRLVLTVDGNVIEVPIYAYPCQPIMDFDDEVDFGTVVANSKVVAKELTLTNTGSKSGDFKIKYNGLKPIAIIPNSGVVPPHSEQKIKVEYVTRISGKFVEQAEVHLEGRDVTKLHIRGFVTDRALELLSVAGDNSKVECVRFGNTYYGTDQTECAILFNNGPEPVNFVAVVDEDAVAQELGVDLTQTTTAALAEEGENKSKRGHTNEITSLITAIPNQGILKPYQKVPIFFRFSPRWYASQQGWKSQVCPPPRKDFALFMRLQIIGSSNGFIHDTKDALLASKSNVEGAYAEVALTGTALPVLLNISPSVKFDFGECPVGEHADILCTIRNESNILPALFEFRRIAHFTAHPPNGKILPGQTQDVIFSFAPKQAGSFKPEQLLDVLGQVADKRNPTVAHAQIIYTLPIKLVGKSHPITIVPKPKFNKGLTPLISNEVGMYVETTFDDLREDHLRNAVAGSTKVKLHRLHRGGSKSADYTNYGGGSGSEQHSAGSVKVAFPNDRAKSIRPFDRKEKFQTMFTRTDRYNYIDPDYAYDDVDIETKMKHRSGYVQQLHKLRERRLAKRQKKEFLETNNNMDIGIKNAAGIFPKKLTQDEILADPLPPLPPNADWKLLSTKELAEAEQVAVSKPVCDGLNAVPTTTEEKVDCSRWLSPQQLHQIVIGPPTIDFGQICLKSTCQRELNIINNLEHHIHVIAEIDCRELRQSSPLSQVVPPQSKAIIPIIFESNTRGRFQRSVVYTVNGFYKHHVTVLAEVVPVAVELSADRLVLKPSPGMPAEAGFRNVITLNNKLNYPAEFTWSPDLGEKGTAFSIRPATGVVDPGTDLDCEVVWHPSFMAPEDGSFTLLINGGDSRKLTCRAELGSTNVYFLDQRITFGAAPVNLTSIASGILHNAGSNHAYFQVSDPNPLPGLTVSPVHGVVPVGGSTEIRVALTPDSIIKFDTRVQVSIKGGKTLELRIGGTVEPPDVNIDVSSFNFGGVYCGSSTTVPFRLENKAITKCRLEVDLTKYKDFSIAFPGCQSQEDFNYQLLNPGMSSVTLEPEEVIEGEITFTPTQVAAYDFILPVVVNHLGAPTPAPTPFPPTPAPSNKNSIQHIINPKPVPAVVTTPRRQVIATALRQPLQLGTNRLQFVLPSNFHDIATNVTMGSTKAVLIINNSNNRLTWGMDLSLSGAVLDKGIFKFLHERGVPFISQGETRGIEGQLEPGQTQTLLVNFCPETAGRYECCIPIVINSDWDKPFQFLEIYGELKAPEIWFDPRSIVLTPVPLHTEVTADFTLLASHYRKPTKIVVTLPEIECDDETKISPLSVTFLQGDEIKPCSGTEAQVDPCALPCRVTFSSPRPVSFSQPILFTDESGQVFFMQVTATADNCLLTCYPFLALHRGDHQIVCEQGSSPKGRKLPSEKAVPRSNTSGGSGEAVFVPCVSPAHIASRPSTSATSSNFQISSSSYESSNSLTDSSGSTTPGPRDGAMNKPPTASDFATGQRNTLENAARSAGSAIFPDEDSEEGMFHLEVLMACQRWFSAQGWPGGAYPVLIPETFRQAISKKTAAEPAKTKDAKDGKGSDTSIGKPQVKVNPRQKVKAGFNKLAKTIYDMINFLSGRSVPGIPINSPLPADPVERVKQIYWQHCTLLTFLRCQGACVSAIQPEYLMAPGDFVLWRQLQRSVKMELVQQGKRQEADKIRIDDEVEEEVFEAISKRMWTDVLLQILKVLVLAKVTPKTLKALSNQEKDIVMPAVNPDPLSSNIYCVGERILLAWMNHHYESYRNEIWQECPKGGIPPSRWIVNFDYDLMDGLVIASLLGAHMPFLIKSHLEGMYTHPATAEQCLHNALKVVNAMKYAGLDYDIQAIDITDPNPIPLLLLAVHLYQRLPQYLPKATMEFTGSLHSTVTRQVKVTNTSPKNLVYHVLIAGRDARDFSVPKGSTVTVPPKSTLPLSVEFKSRFLRSAQAVLVLVGRRQGAATGNTLTFNLTTEIDNIKPKATVKVESPCYELERVMLEVTNPFSEGGEFRIVLIESNVTPTDTSRSTTHLKSKEWNRSKTVRSKINNGRKRPDTPPEVIPMNRILEQQEQKNTQIPKLMAFYTPMRTVNLQPQVPTEVEVDFLPFHVGERQCSVIFLNEKIGEFLYSIEAKALEPLPSYLPYVPNKRSVRISSAAAAGSGRGHYGGDDSIIYWKCESGVTLKESLLIPVTNMVKERALIIAAQQQMSDVEMQRRQVTGTIMSCSVTSQTIKNLSNNPIAAVTMAKAVGPVADVYRVEVDSEFFKVPDMLVMPSPLDARRHAVPAGTRVPKDVNLADGVAELPVQFKAKDPGHYPATITLRSNDDIRVYRIECTVNPEGSTAELEFSAPVHQSITQDIPIMNVTNNDWPLQATITGDGFSGPGTLLAKAFMTTQFPLVFKPLKEEEINGKLILTNKEDGTEHIFHLTGKGQKPLALDQIKLICGAKASVMHTVKVPNVTKKKLTYRVESDLPFVTGNQTVTVLAQQTGSYTFAVTPTQRGKFKGVVAFVAGENPHKEVDSDGEEQPVDEGSKDYYGYRMWYSLEVDVKPPVPERSMTVICACQKKAVLEVIVRNPTPKQLTLSTTIKGRDLSGPMMITLPPGEKDVYTLTFAPSQVGETRGSLIFFNEDVGEFWYDLLLKAESPPPTTLPHMECELGKWTKQNISLNNPTDETLELIPTISNTNNFSLERDNERPLVLRPHCSVEVPLRFMPSSLGEADHLAKIIFISEQLGEWVFVASGTGLVPRPQAPVSTYTAAGSNTTLIIPFRNPTDVPVLADIILTDTETGPGYPASDLRDSPFKLLLKHDTGLRVGPKSTLEIPISFAPSQMVNYQAFCTVVIRREDSHQWPYVPQDALGHKLSAHTTGLPEIRWLFPVHGVPESAPMKDTQPAGITCQARDLVEQRLEVTLAGVAPGSNGVSSLATRAKTPKDAKPNIPEGVVVGNTMATAEEFSFELSHSSDEAEDVLKNSLSMSIARHYRDPATGLVTLIFNMRFTPCKTMDHQITLLVRAATGGLWKFPLRFTATEPPVDDTVLIEATGLGKASNVGFRLNSQQKHPAVFNAFFEAGSDPEFSVTPETGELMPGGTPGTLFTVSFLPNVYGKLYNAKLIIQTPDMQWSYCIRGVLPEYQPPRGVSAKPIAGPHPPLEKPSGRRRNYIRENLKLIATAVSSPIKGAHLMAHTAVAK